MAVEKVTSTALFFRCRAKQGTCNSLNEIPFADIRVFSRASGRFGLTLPNCPKCGAQTGVIPSKVRETAMNHVRRIAWKRAVASGNFFDEESRSTANDHTKDLDAFYAAPGREELKSDYDDNSSTVSVAKKISEPEE
jgi:hypothetical protein